MPPKPYKYRPPPRKPTTKLKSLGYLNKRLRENMKRLRKGRTGR